MVGRWVLAWPWLVQPRIGDSWAAILVLGLARLIPWVAARPSQNRLRGMKESAPGPGS